MKLVLVVVSMSVKYRRKKKIDEITRLEYCAIRLCDWFRECCYRIVYFIVVEKNIYARYMRVRQIDSIMFRHALTLVKRWMR